MLGFLQATHEQNELVDLANKHRHKAYNAQASLDEAVQACLAISARSCFFSFSSFSINFKPRLNVFLYQEASELTIANFKNPDPINIKAFLPFVLSGVGKNDDPGFQAIVPNYLCTEYDQLMSRAMRYQKRLAKQVGKR